MGLYIVVLAARCKAAIRIMSVSTVFRVQETPLPIPEVVSILKNPPVDGISNLPPAKPKAGEIYIFQSDDNTKHGMLNMCMYCT